jgi:hypothetical protein
MVEEQQHGFAFQNRVLELAKKLSPDRIHHLGAYTGKWDLPPELNPNPQLGPISIKTAKWNSSICFGDACRQYQIDHIFTLVIGFWERVRDEKRIVKIVSVAVKPNVWASLWNPITLTDLMRLDRQIKDKKLTYKEARMLARNALKAPPFSNSIFRVNPKIDSKKQRRLQCSLTQQNFFRHLAPEIIPQKEEAPSLWGVRISSLPGGPRFGAV